MADLGLGFRRKKPIAGIRSKKFGFCAAITSVETFEFVVKEEEFEGESYFWFLTDLFVKLEEKNIVNVTIIADNVPFYKMTVIKNFAAEKIII